MIQSFTCFDWHQEWKRYVYITDAKAVISLYAACNKKNCIAY